MNENANDAVYVALIGDIRSSRELDDRAAAQEAFKGVVNSLTDHVPAGSVASPFTVTTGDEFQVLLTDAADAVAAAVAASDRFEAARLRFGVGRGGLDTEVNATQAIGMDGPCFHRAREAIRSAKEDGAWLRASGWPGELDGRVNPLLDLIQRVREDWTDRQAEFALALAEHGTQKAVAEQYDVSKSTVSESLSAGHVRAVRRAEHSVAALLQDGLPGVDDP